MVKFFFTKCMANDEFSKPPRRADSKNPVFIFCRFLCLGHLRGLGSVSVGFRGSRQLSPFWGGGGSSQGALSPPPPPFQLQARLPQCIGRGECHEALRTRLLRGVQVDAVFLNNESVTCKSPPLWDPEFMNQGFNILFSPLNGSTFAYIDNLHGVGRHLPDA